MAIQSIRPFVWVVLLVGGMAPSVALSHTSKAAYDWHVGDALLQSLGFPAGEQAMAPNGDVVTIEGSGAFSADGKWATGGGTFAHHVAATDATTEQEAQSRRDGTSETSLEFQGVERARCR